MYFSNKVKKVNIMEFYFKLRLIMLMLPLLEYEVKFLDVRTYVLRDIKIQFYTQTQYTNTILASLLFFVIIIPLSLSYEKNSLFSQKNAKTSIKLK